MTTVNKKSVVQNHSAQINGSVMITWSDRLKKVLSKVTNRSMLRAKTPSTDSVATARNSHSTHDRRRGFRNYS